MYEHFQNRKIILIYSNFFKILCGSKKPQCWFKINPFLDNQHIQSIKQYCFVNKALLYYVGVCGTMTDMEVKQTAYF